MAQPSPTTSRDAGAPAWLIGAAVVAGWLLHDGLKFLYGRDVTGGAPLVAPSLAAVALGALAGLAAGRRRWIAPAVFALALAAVCAQRLFGEQQVPRVIWAPRVAALLVLAYLLAGFGARRGLGALRSGLCLGALACVLVCWRRGLWGPASLHVLIAAGGTLALGALPWRKPRWFATGVLASIPLWIGVSHVLELARPRRPDLAAPAAAAPRAPNLILVVLDTVRADRLAPYGYQRATTPSLDAFVQQHCVRYTQARSAGSYTLPSHASMFTGLFPAEHGADNPRAPLDPDAAGRETVKRLSIAAAHGLREDVPTLAGVLRERGYRTAGVVANNAYLHHAYGLDRGFEHWDDRDPAWLAEYLTLVQYAGVRLRTGHIPYRDGDAITAGALSWIEGLDGARPFFLMLNYMDAHSPYFPTRANRSAFSERQPADPLGPPRADFPLLYDRCLLDLDAHLDALFSGLDAAGVLEDAVVIVTSDHGEAFGEHGHFNHAWTLYEELVHVPLYVKPAGRRERAEDPTPISGVDLPALALNELGLAPWPGAVAETPGRGALQSEWYHGEGGPQLDAWAERTGRAPDADRLAWLEGGLKWIVGSDGSVEAFDLASDPGERAAVELDPAQVAAAVHRARAWWAANPPLTRSAVQGAPELDQAHLENLRGLGYLGEE